MILEEANYHYFDYDIQSQRNEVLGLIRASRVNLED